MILRSDLLGSLLLLLLLLATVGGSLFAALFAALAAITSGLGLGLLLLLLLLATSGNEKSDHSFGFNEAVVIDLEFAEDVVALGFGELVAKVHQGVAEHLGLDLALVLVGLEGAHDEVIGVVGAYSIVVCIISRTNSGSLDLCQLFRKQLHIGTI